MSHTSKVVSVHDLADGILAVGVRCCDDPTTDSFLTVHEPQRDDGEIDKDIADHQARVEKLHADKLRVKEHIERLCKK